MQLNCLLNRDIDFLEFIAIIYCDIPQKKDLSWRGNNCDILGIRFQGFPAIQVKNTVVTPSNFVGFC